MVFNSLVFVLFIMLVYPLVAALNRWVRARNTVLLVASYVFYGWWDWRFLFLFALTTIVDFSCSLRMASVDAKGGTASARRNFLLISVSCNLLILAFFKYFNFFIDSAQELVRILGLSVNTPSLEIILPVGISFYTFQSMSYTIDVYRRVIPVERSWLTYAAYLSFFPQLVAGPIERASHLIPQFRSSGRINLHNFYVGMYLISWGLVKKVVVADNISRIADDLFRSESPGGLDVILGVIAFSVQVYTDFSGYSDIACGLSKAMGFDLMFNFRQPFFATNPSEFWRRWHISLSTWLRDYLYIPLGGNRGGDFKTDRNLLITMILGGLWHGAAWNFVVWGLYHGICLIAHRHFAQFAARRVEINGWAGRRLWFLIRWMSFLVITGIGWLLFRAVSLGQAVRFLSAAVVDPVSRRVISSETDILALIASILVLVTIDLLNERSESQVAVLRLPVVIRALIYAAMIVSFLVFGNFGNDSFIYFQF